MTMVLVNVIEVVPKNAIPYNKKGILAILFSVFTECSAHFLLLIKKEEMKMTDKKAKERIEHVLPRLRHTTTTLHGW